MNCQDSLLPFFSEMDIIWKITWYHIGEFAMKEAIQPEGLAPAIGIYSPAVLAGNWIYVSGQLPPSDVEIEGDIKTQTLHILDNIERILAAAGTGETGRNDIVKTTVYLMDMSDFPAVNEAYNVFFTAPYPARVCVQVAGLPKNARIEIDAIAYRKSGN